MGYRTMTTVIKGRYLRQVGERDARAGKPIEAFYEISKIRHSESERASYEIGYRATKDEMRENRRNHDSE